MTIAAEFLSAIINALEVNKRLADRAVNQHPALHRPARDVELLDVRFEREHLKAKLRRRDPDWYRAFCRHPILAHPLFVVTARPVEPWERGR